MTSCLTSSYLTSFYVFPDDRAQPLAGFGGDLVGRCNDSMPQRLSAFTLAGAVREFRHRASNKLLSVRGVTVEKIDDHLDRYRVMVGVPAVVIGDQRHRRVTYLRLARELRLLKVCHADDVHPPGAV